MTYKGICVGGSHHGNEIESEHKRFEIPKEPRPSLWDMKTDPRKTLEIEHYRLERVVIKGCTHILFLEDSVDINSVIKIIAKEWEGRPR